MYDAESMNITADGVDRIAEDFRTSKGKLKGCVGPEGRAGQSPFGEVEDPDDPDQVAGTLGSFTTGMQDEFEAAAGLMSAAGSALREAVRTMKETDAVAADNLTMREVR
ncbi:hypothetical protein [Qaidamihabitans albus]|uniref:hypothetical protein n=1 Tax=Qaidamihabitans albus TaxID=2795733 RepID=UPI0027DCB66A|nr:hypothetical protein [Qaidamihabitans albus]